MGSYSARSLLKNTIIISLGSAGAGVIKFVNVLCLTYFVAVDQMGDYDLAITYASLAFPIACMAMYEGVFRWMLDEGASKEDTARTSIVVMAASLIVFEAVAIPLMASLGYGYPVEMAALIVAESVNTYSQYALRGMHKNKAFAVQGIVYALALILTNVILVIVIPMQASGLMWSVVVADVCSAMFALVSVRYVTRYVSRGLFRKDLAIRLLRYSIPIMPNTMAWWLVSGSNRVMVGWVLGSAANGIFAIANRFPSILNMCTRFFYQAWQEQAISVDNDEERDAYYSGVFNSYVRLLLSGVVLLLPFSKIAIALVSPDYYEAILYLGPLYLSCAFSAMSSFYGTGYLKSRKTFGAFTTTVVGAIVNVAFTAVTISLLGLHAAALGSMFGNLAIWLVRMAQTRRYFRIHIRVLEFIGLLVACVTVSLLLQVESTPVLVATTVMAAVLFVAINRSLAGKMLSMVRG